MAARGGPRGKAAAVAMLRRGTVGVVRLEGTGAVAHARVVRARGLRPGVHPRLRAGVRSGRRAVPISASSRRHAHAPASPSVLVIHHPCASIPPPREVDEPAEALGQGRKALNAGHPRVFCGSSRRLHVHPSSDQTISYHELLPRISFPFSSLKWRFPLRFLFFPLQHCQLLNPANITTLTHAPSESSRAHVQMHSNNRGSHSLQALKH